MSNRNRISAEYDCAVYVSAHWSRARHEPAAIRDVGRSPFTTRVRCWRPRPSPATALQSQPPETRPDVVADPLAFLSACRSRIDGARAGATFILAFLAGSALAVRSPACVVWSDCRSHGSRALLVIALFLSVANQSGYAWPHAWPRDSCATAMVTAARMLVPPLRPSDGHNDRKNRSFTDLRGLQTIQPMTITPQDRSADAGRGRVLRDLPRGWFFRLKFYAAAISRLRQTVVAHSPIRATF